MRRSRVVFVSIFLWWFVAYECFRGSRVTYTCNVRALLSIRNRMWKAGVNRGRHYLGDYIMN